MRVIIDGTIYEPSYRSEIVGGSVSFGVAVTTRNRPQICCDTIEAIDSYVPPEVPIIVVDDGSPEAFGRGLPLDRFIIVRNEEAQGIPAAKNRCIEELMKAGVDHLFLFDDDCRPVENDWWTPYLESPEHHLQFSWTHFADGCSVPKMQIVHRMSDLVGYTWSMGCMLYVTRAAINRVGGMRPEFGMGMEEHAEWSQRIHNAGLTTFVHQDIPNSDALLWSGDKMQTVSRTIDFNMRAELVERNTALRERHRRSRDFVPYARSDNRIITAYLNSVGDPQRGNERHSPDPKIVEPLALSVVESGAGFEVITDCLESVPHAEVIRRPPSDYEAYRQRWVHYYQRLREEPSIGFAWLVDATDVIMLNDPFPSMKPGVLYVGYEPKTVGTQWIKEHSKRISDWIEENSQRMLLNVGLVGGDRETLIELCSSMIDCWFQYHVADSMHEMGFFNRVVYEQFSGRFETGPQICTVFKSHATSDPVAWWAHK